MYANNENCQYTHRPKWVLNPLHDDQNYYGISSAAFTTNKPNYQTIERAKDRAIKDLSYGLSVDIQSLYKEQLSLYKDDEIKSSLMLSVSLVLNGIKVYDQWTDFNKKQHWVMVSINQSSADKQVKAQEFINQVLKCLKSGQKEIRQSIDSMNEIINIRMKRIEQHIIELTKVIDNKSTASIYIETQPSNASIYINDQYKGTSPKMLTIVTPDIISIKIKKEKYKTITKTINTHSEKYTNHLKINLELNIKIGNLYIKANPIDARIRILNIKQIFYQGISLHTGKYRIEVTKYGYEKFDEWRTINEGQNIIDIRLNKNKTNITSVDLLEHESGLSIRSIPKTVSKNIFLNVFNISSEWRPKIYVENTFLSKKESLFVIDKNNKLMWQKKGSQYAISYTKSLDYIKELNNSKFSNYSDWRLPTVDELLSIVERNKQNNDLYIKPLFDSQQKMCWSSDLHLDNTGWAVSFEYGSVLPRGCFDDNYVRAVRSTQEY